VLTKWNRRRGLAFFTMLWLASFQAQGCSKSSRATNDVVFACDSDPKPPRTGRNTFTVSLTGPAGEPLAGAHVSLEGDMSHPGMSPVFGEAKEVGPGRYQGVLDLNMLGDWTILFHITLSSGRTFDRETKIQNLQAN
jgi:YtkA-like